MDSYDVVVIGSRVAGASCARLLARAGLSVLAVDRARFPSDTLSSHQLQVPGAAALARWGLLDGLVSTGMPATREVSFDAGPAVLHGRLPRVGTIGEMYSPRRTVLDSFLVAAAADAGADVLTGFEVEDLVRQGGRVVGIRGRSRGSQQVAARTISARLVVGADGKNSFLARAVGARTVRRDPVTAAAFYAYWHGLQLPHGEMYARPRRVVGAWASHDGLVVTYVGLPAEDFATFRSDPDRMLRQALDGAGTLGERVRAATRVGPVRGTSDLPNGIRASAGAGWALIGDAGLVMDPITGQGISHAFDDAERLAGAVIRALGGGRPLERETLRYQRERDAARRPMYEFTVDLARFRPRPGTDTLFEAVAADQAQTDHFLAVLAGVASPQSFFAPRNLRRLLGWRGMLALATGRAR